MGRHKEHAEHNESLSTSLYDGNTYLDWANTTAFYSALHFVSCKILPGEYNGKICKTISDAMFALNCNSKHEATSEMVGIKFPSIHNQYKFLMDASFTARYHDYIVHAEHAKICQRMLRKIKAQCFPPEE